MRIINTLQIKYWVGVKIKIQVNFMKNNTNLSNKYLKYNFIFYYFIMNINSSNKVPSRTKSQSFHKQLHQNKHTILTNQIISKSKKNREFETKNFEFGPVNNARLNQIYKNFLQKNQKAQQYITTQEDRIQTQYELIKRNQRIETNNSIQPYKKKNLLMNMNYIDLNEQQKSQVYNLDSPNSTLKEPKSVVVKMNQQSNSKKNLEKKSLKEISVQVDKMKVRFQSSIFQNISQTEQILIDKLKQVNEKVINNQLKITKLIGFITNLSHMLNRMRYRAKQNQILKQLNKQLELKLNVLQNQKMTSKQFKELESLKEAVTRVRQNNSMRQERGATPNKQRFEIQKKVLLRQNVDLKKKIQQFKKQFEKKQQQYQSIYSHYSQLQQYIKEMETKNKHSQNFQSTIQYKKMHQYIEELEQKLHKMAQMQVKLQKLQQNDKKLQLMEFEMDRKQLIIEENIKSINTLKQSCMKKDEENKNLRSDIRKINQNTEQQNEKLRKTIQQQRNELKKLHNKQIQNRKELIQLKSEVQKRQIEKIQKNNQLNELQQKIKKLKQTQLQRPQIDLNGISQGYQNQLNQLQQVNKSLLNQNQLLKNQSQKLQTQCKDIKQQLIIYKNQHQKEIKKNQSLNKQIQIILNHLKKLQKGEFIKYKGNNSEMSKIFAGLLQKYQKYQQKIQKLQLQNKKMIMHKNKMDHILHEQDAVQYNDFETTHVDAYYFRQKNNNNEDLKIQLKNVAQKLDKQLQQNIKLKKQIAKLKKKLEENQKNTKLASESFSKLMKILDSKDKKQKQTQLNLLLSSLQLLEQRQFYKKLLVK